MPRHERAQSIERERMHGAILVSAEVQPSWYLSVISLQTFGNTMGNVGRGVRLQAIRNRDTRAEMLRRINNEYFSANPTEYEAAPVKGITKKGGHTVTFDLGDKLPPDPSTAKTPSLIQETPIEDNQHEITTVGNGLHTNDHAGLASECQSVQPVGHAEAVVHEISTGAQSAESKGMGGHVLCSNLPRYQMRSAEKSNHLQGEGNPFE